MIRTWTASMCPSAARRGGQTEPFARNGVTSTTRPNVRLGRTCQHLSGSERWPALKDRPDLGGGGCGRCTDAFGGGGFRSLRTFVLWSRAMCPTPVATRCGSTEVATHYAHSRAASPSVKTCRHPTVRGAEYGFQAVISGCRKLKTCSSVGRRERCPGRMVGRPRLDSLW